MIHHWYQSLQFLNILFPSFFLYLLLNLLEITDLPICFHSCFYEFFALISTICRIKEGDIITIIYVMINRLHVKYPCFAYDLTYFGTRLLTIASPELLILGGVHQLHHLVDRATRNYQTLGQLNAIANLACFLSFLFLSYFSRTFLTSLSLFIQKDLFLLFNWGFC